MLDAPNQVLKMMTLKNIVFILLLFLSFHASRLTFDVMSQDDDIGFWNWQGKLGFNRTLLQLTANTDTAWAGGYMVTHNASDTANTGTGTFVYYMGGNPRLKIRQTGTVWKVNFYIFDASLITSFKILYLRHTNPYVNGVFVTDSVFTGEELKTQIANGDNNIILTQPVAVQSDDVYAIQIIATGNGISIPYNASFNSYSFTSVQANTNGKNWAAGTLQAGRYFPIKFYIQAPIFVAIGDSWVDGIGKGIANVSTTLPIAYVSGASNQTYYLSQYYNPKHTQWYSLGAITGWTNQNMGISSQTSTQIQARFKTDCTDLKPRIAIIDGGTNDVTLYSAAIFANIKKMIDSCRANNIVPVVCGTIPVTNTGYTDSTMRIDDSVDVLTQNYCNSLGVFFLNVKNIQGRFRTGGDAGNKWGVPQWFMAGDSVHTNRNCNSVNERHILDYLKTKYIINDTARAYLQHTPLPQIIRQDTSYTLTCNTYSLKGFDSTCADWKIGANGTVHHLTMNISSATDILDYWTTYIALDTSVAKAGDTLIYTITGYSYIPVSTTVNLVVADIDTDVYAYFVRAGVSDTALHWRAGVNTYITSLKAHGLYTDIAALYIHAAYDTTAALANVISSSFGAITLSTPLFTPLEGFTGDGTADVIIYNFMLSTDGGSIYTQNDAGIFCYQRVASPTSAKFWWGAFTPGHACYLEPSGTTIVFDINTATDGSDANTNRLGGWDVNRILATSNQLYYNGLLAEVDTANSVTIPAAKLYGLALNNNGPPGSFSNCQLSIMCIHGGWNAAQEADFNTDTETFMDYLGKGVE